MIFIKLAKIIVFYQLFSGIKCQSPAVIAKNLNTCLRLAEDPNFDIDVVVGEPWRVYYTWNMNVNTACLDIVLKNATRRIVERFKTNMNVYLEQQPAWEAAILHMKMKSQSYEVLLIGNQGTAGTFLAVPNIKNYPNMNPTWKSVPLLKFQMKLIFNARFLLIMDCHLGRASLTARASQSPARSEVESAVATLGLGDGYPACTTEKHPKDYFLV